MDVWEVIIIAFAILASSAAVVLWMLIAPARIMINRAIRKMKSDMKWDVAHSLSVSREVFVRADDNRMLWMLAKHASHYHPYDVESAVLALRRAGVKHSVTAEQLDAIAIINDARGRKMTLEDHDQWKPVMSYVVAHPEDATAMARVIDRGEREMGRITAGVHLLKSGGAPSLLEGAL